MHQPHALTLALFASLLLLPGPAHGSPEPTRWERIRAAEVVVVTGSADHMEHVLRRAGVRFELAAPADVAQLPLHGQQVLMVNCTAPLPPEGRERVRRFVRAGGFLYTTDHAVRNLIEPVFPGFIRMVGSSSQKVFPMELVGHERGLLQHLATDGPPRWQLAGGGHLFEVVDKQRVEVLMRSEAVQAQYGKGGVLGVRFRVDDGVVIHVTGHFHTQPGQQPGVASAGRAFEQLSENVVQAKRADQPRLQRLYDRAPKKAVVFRAAPKPTAPTVATPAAEAPVQTSPSLPVRVLEEEDGYSRVRDAEGNEGWVPSDAL